ncbi:LPS-assembly protein LptD [Pelagibacterales bacterium SAG-MED23]|nr:LPS-assembly protein LptD [Pelagibacterales bacterium SAG-MED23]
MKIDTYIKILFFFFIFVNTNLSAETIFFDSKNIKIENDGNMIFATKGTAEIPKKYVNIEGDKFVYDKVNFELTVFDNVRYYDKQNNIVILSQKLIYNELKNIVFSQNETLIEIENTYQINSSNVLFDRNLNKISSNDLTEVNDEINNQFIFNDGLVFDVNEEIISSKKAIITDVNLNKYIFENSKLNLKINEIVGREIKVDFEDSFFGNEENDPILKGSSVLSNDNNTKIYKTVFSTCSIENKNCRGWEMQSEIFNHDKIKKLFEYEKSWFKVFDKKIFYLPYFNHPDPSVKRKSGFLTPFYKGSDNLGSSINIPYFYAISDSRDLTFKPRIYFDNDYILQSEYRESFENSELIVDFSFNKNENTNTHFFAELDGDIDNTTSFQVQIQNVTNDNYLKIHDIKEYTPLIKNDSTLLSFVRLDKDIDENTNFYSSIKLYEDLSKEDEKYQYIFPDFNFSKNIELDESYNGNFQFLSSGFQKVYETNKYETLINNDFNFNSFDYISSGGIKTDYSLLLKNYNTYSENSSTYENKNDHEIFGTILLKSELPLKKELDNSNNFLKPIMQLRFSPTNGKDISDSNTRLDYDNIFSPNRIGRSDMVEKGSSLTVGIDYEKQNLENEKIMGFNLGNVFKYKKNEDLPTKTKLDQTRSDIMGNIFYKLNDNIKFDYDFSLDRDLEYSNYDSIHATFGLNKLYTSFDYVTENHDFGDSEIISNETKYEFNNEQAIKYKTTRELKDDFTQFYKLSYLYETDCLLATFEYQKKFYRDRNLVPDESLAFLIKFIPFTEVRGTANTIFEN